MEKNRDDLGLNKIETLLSELSNRVSRIESYLELETAENSNQKKLLKSSKSADAIELEIGEFWFAKVGIIVLSVGIAFLLTLGYKDYPPALPSIIGYIITAILFFTSYSIRKSFDNISRYLLGSFVFILFFSTLRLHFFTDQPAVSNPMIEIFLLAVVVGFSFILAIKRKSDYFSALSIMMGLMTALTSPYAYPLLFSILLVAGLIAYTKYRFQWNGLFIFGIGLTYFTHFIWFLNNPFLGNGIRLVDGPATNLLFIIAYIAIFALANLKRGDTSIENTPTISSTFLNGFMGLSLILLVGLTKFRSNFDLICYLSSTVFLLLAVYYWIREKSKFSTFFYAMFGYAALSVAIILQFEKENTLIWLCWQSIIVISTAIWFRSKFIIVANFFIYTFILLAYILVIHTFNLMSLSFGVAALLSARILNWQKDRLELKTDYMRIVYLLSAFFTFPYTLYKLVPERYVTISWIVIAFVYYILSKILNNRKYRLMALGTLLLAVIYIFIIGMIHLEPVYRTTSFIVLGIVLIITSVLYTRIRKKKDKEEKIS